MNTYFVVDVETDGRIPGRNSMLSLGCAAFERGNLDALATFEVNLTPLPNAAPDPRTTAWWETQSPSVREYVTRDPVDPNTAVSRFVEWVRAVGGKPHLVTFPFDHMWTTWYLHRFATNPFGSETIDLRTLLCVVLNPRRFGLTRLDANLPRVLVEGVPPRRHPALVAAIARGEMFLELLHASRQIL